MPSKPNGPIRRSQLIAPFGPGAMITVPGGTSLVVAASDMWFQDASSSGRRIDHNEFRIHEWRLQRRLGVSHFRLPPDYREPGWLGSEVPNARITIPAFRFPMWHFCPSCKLLALRPTFERGSGGRVNCPECEAKKGTRYMFQVPFIAMCQNGHLQDFPWREWVHRSISPDCTGPLRLEATGAATLAGQRVSCDMCHASRTLAGITAANPQGTSTTLSSTLAEGVPFHCMGRKPWLGSDESEPCTLPIRGSLRSASNVYFAHVRSSIYLPRASDDGLQSLLDLLDSYPLSTLVKMLSDLGADDSRVRELLRSQHGVRLREFTDAQITKAYQIATASGPEDTLAPLGPGEEIPTVDDNEETDFRRAEFRSLRQPSEGENLTVRLEDPVSYDKEIHKYFARITLIDRLRETRALVGFTRVFPETGQDRQTIGRLIWKKQHENEDESWLPAYNVFGEGIFLEFDGTRLEQWETRPEVSERILRLIRRFTEAQQKRRIRHTTVGPRFVLLHTFAHLLMNRLTFECGYSSAALRERLYVSDNPEASMAGVLIYTADGDSEGTLGGLVRMGTPGNLEPAIRRALEDAQWCSADPVCMEIGRNQGQGPDSCNLAACHNCALVPETACEEFNRFLDRGVVVGDMQNSGLGYFSS